MLTIAPSHEKIAHVHDECAFQRNGVDKVAWLFWVFDLQAAALILEEHGDGAPVRMGGHCNNSSVVVMIIELSWKTPTARHGITL